MHYYHLFRGSGKGFDSDRLAATADSTAGFPGGDVTFLGLEEGAHGFLGGHFGDGCLLGKGLLLPRPGLRTLIHDGLTLWTSLENHVVGTSSSIHSVHTVEWDLLPRACVDTVGLDPLALLAGDSVDRFLAGG